MKKIIIFLSLFFILACGKDKTIETQQDNISNKTNIASVAKSNEIELTKGNQLFVNGNIEGAIEHYKKGIKANRSLAYYNMGVSYYLLGNFDKSAKYFELALKENPEFTQAKINLSSTYLHLNRLNDAEDLINDLIKNNTSAKIYINAANIFLEKGDTAKAYYFFEKAYKISPDLPFVKLNYGNFLISIANYEQGIPILESFEDKDYNIYYNLAQAYFNKKNYKKSIEYIKEALQKNKTIEAYKLLSNNYIQIKDYPLAAEAYNYILKIDNRWDYRYTYAKYLYLSKDIRPAEKILIKLKKERPKEIKVYNFLYKIYDMNNERVKAFSIAKQAYLNIKTDEAIYLYARDIMLYQKKYQVERIKSIFFNKKDSDYLNLSRALYFLKNKKYSIANNYLDKIQSISNSDYFVYKTFINIKNKDFVEAAKNVNKIDKSRYEYVWLSFITYWNQKDTNSLINLTKFASGNIKEFHRRPKINFEIEPNISDLDFSYRFDGDLKSFTNALMMPYAIEPDKMFSFLALGYKLLEDNEQLKALVELKKSIVFSQGIEINNNAVIAFFNHNYKKALNLFFKANKLIKKNPIILHNIGVTYLNLGYTQKAFTYFDNAILFNRFMFPSYLGKAAIYQNYGKFEKSLMEYDNLINSIKIFQKSDTKIPAFFLYSKYFAYAGLGKYDKAIQEILLQDEKNDYLQTILSIISYLKTKNPEKIFKLNELNVFRNKLIVNSVEQLNNIGNFSNIDYNDRYSNAIAEYISLKKGKEIKLFQNTNDKVLLKENILKYIVQKDSKKALLEMKKLSRKYFRYPQLYKASYYYFLWQKDFLNAEASYTSISNLNKKDIYSDYYNLLYFLLNYNGKRLHKKINIYIEKYPVDYRGLVIDLLNSFKSNRVKRMYNDLLSLEQLDPKFIEKVSLVIKLEDL